MSGNAFAVSENYVVQPVMKALHVLEYVAEEGRELALTAPAKPPPDVPADHSATHPPIRHTSCRWEPYGTDWNRFPQILTEKRVRSSVRFITIYASYQISDFVPEKWTLFEDTTLAVPSSAETKSGSEKQSQRRFGILNFSSLYHGQCLRHSGWHQLHEFIRFPA